MSSFDATRPGRIWLIEHELGHSLAGSDRAALTEVNVVLYRRAVAPVLASVLPLGAYAEATGEAALSPRAIAFAGEGWSVAQLVEACDDSEARLRCLFEALNALGRTPICRCRSSSNRRSAGSGNWICRSAPPPRAFVMSRVKGC